MAHLDQFDISDAKKKYITDEVNPLLEELVREPLPHMIAWLKEKAGQQKYDEEAIAKENAALTEEIKQMKVKLEEVSSKTATATQEQKKEEDEEEEEEDDDDIPE